MSAPLICTDRSAVEVKDKSVFALLYVCVCVWMSMRGAVRAAESQIWGGLQECSLPLKSLLSVLNKYQAQNEGNVASQGSIQPCFIKGSRSFFSSSCLCCCWGWRGHIHTDEVSWTPGCSSKRHSGRPSPGWVDHSKTEVCGCNASFF